MTIADGLTEARSEQVIRFRIEVTNTGPDAATGVTLADTFTSPDGLFYSPNFGSPRPSAARPCPQPWGPTRSPSPPTFRSEAGWRSWPSSRFTSEPAAVLVATATATVAPGDADPEPV